MTDICRHAGIACTLCEQPNTLQPDAVHIAELLAADPSITHVSMVHSETTSGILNDIEAFAKAMEELEQEGGIPVRHARYAANQRLLALRFGEMGFKPYLDPSVQAVVKVGDTVSDIQEGQERRCLLARRARGQQHDGHDADGL